MSNITFIFYFYVSNCVTGTEYVGFWAIAGTNNWSSFGRCSPLDTSLWQIAPGGWSPGDHYVLSYLGVNSAEGSIAYLIVNIFSIGRWSIEAPIEVQGILYFCWEFNEASNGGSKTKWAKIYNDGSWERSNFCHVIGWESAATKNFPEASYYGILLVSAVFDQD